MSTAILSDRVRSPAGFDVEATFDEDYQYIYETFLTEERNAAEVEHLRAAAGITAGERVLDVGCGYGRISNRLAALGCQVTGLDVSAPLLHAAHTAAREQRLAVNYVRGDMRNLPWRDHFDVLVNWMAAFGYFDDIANHAVLREFCLALKPGGRLAMQIFSRDGVLKNWGKYAIVERGDDLAIDKRTFDISTGRMMNRRTIVRNGITRRVEFFVRLLSVNEAIEWLEAAGFEAVTATGPNGDPVTLDDVWLTVTATKPATAG
jgi:SAM-dependent methyltransferase